MQAGVIVAGTVLMFAGLLSLPMATRDRRARHRSSDFAVATSVLAIGYGLFLLIFGVTQ